MKQLEFDFDVPANVNVLRTHAIREHIWNDDIEDDDDCVLNLKEDWFRTTKFGDWLLDKIPYGWNIYNKYTDFVHYTITKYQQLRYGVADSECWSLDYTFTRYMLPRLKHFKKMTRYSHPSDVTPEEWENILDEIIWAFEYMADEDAFLPMPPCDMDMEQIFDPNRPKTLEREMMWRDYFEKLNVYQHRKEQALKLFAKYYEALWD